MLLRKADRLQDVTRRLAACFADHRYPRRTEHSVAAMIAQRVMVLALGYTDLNEHDRLCSDPALALASGCDDLAGNIVSLPCNLRKFFAIRMVCSWDHGPRARQV